MDIVSQLLRDEGKRKFPYTDTVGKLTIGVGRNLTDVGLSDDEITMLLRNDIAKIATQLDSRLPWYDALDDVRKGAIINMGFNLGFDGLERFPRFLMFMAQGNWSGAAVEMLNSEWARQVSDRAVRLSQQIKTGEWV